MIAEALLTVLTSLPVCWADRGVPANEKASQLEVIAAALLARTQDPSELAYLTSIAYHESRLCIAVHAGRVRGRGRGLFQIEPGSRRVPPFTGLSFEATEHAAGEALWMVRHSHQCGSTPADRFTAYAGRECEKYWPSLRSRVALWYSVRARLTAI